MVSGVLTTMYRSKKHWCGGTRRYVCNNACILCHATLRTIRSRMLYWYNRIILGKKANDSGTSTRQSLQSGHNFNRRKRYAKFRALGATSYEAAARINGNTAQEERARLLRQSRQRRAKWGGATHMGSEAHKRWLLAKCGVE